MEERNILGEEKIYKLLIKFSLPAIVGMTVNSLYNVVDRIFIGNSPDLGMNGLAGITIAFPIMIIIMAVGILFGVGGATRFAIKLGEGDKEEAEKTLGSVFTMLIISSIVLTILGLIFLKPLVVLFGASEEVAPFAVEYLRMIILGSIFKIVSMGFNNIIRADGSPKIAMYTMLIGAITNIILDPIFIFGFRMGMFGAGLATIIAQSLSFIWVILYFAGKRSNNKLRLRYMKPDLDIVKRVVGLGIPDSTLQIANSVLNTVLNRSLLFYGGDLAVSVMGIINSVATLLLLPVVGLRQGLQPIISFNYGAKKYPRVKQALKLGLIIATCIVIVSYTITRVFPGQLVGFFNREEEMISFGIEAMRAWFLLLPVVGIQIIGSSFFQAIGRFKIASFLTLTRQLILLIPAVIIFPRIWGLKGLIHAAPFADFFSFLLTSTWLFIWIKFKSFDQDKS